MSETTPKSFWRKPWSGWRGFLLWYALVTGAAFVMIFCYSLLERTNDRFIELVLGSLLFAFTLALIAVLGFCFVRWLCHWRNFRRFGFVVACLVTLIVLFLTEENWRGRRAWNKYRAAAEAEGEHFSFAALAPPPVPDGKNFALTPLLKPAVDYTHTTNGVEWRDTNGLARLHGIRADLSSHPEKLVVGSLAKGTLTDLGACRDFYRGNTYYPQPTVSGTAAADVLVALGKFDAELMELREAADARPESRFPIEDHYELTAAILLPHLAPVRGIGRLVELRAIARLELGQSDEAFKDLKLGFRLADSLANEPLLIDQLVRIDTLSLALQVMREGLARHSWSDAQLAELESYLVSQDLLLAYKSGIRGERACMINGLEYYHRRGVHGSPFDFTSSEGDGRPSIIPGFINRMAGGFYYQNILTIARTHEKYTLPAVDEKAHRIYPEFADRLDQELETLHRQIYRHPYKVFTALLFPALTRSVSRSGRAQTYVDAARVACALERFRLANGRLPEKLDALVPRFIDVIPNDVMDGQPLRYRRSDDGGYVLYSIGWNRVDEGGKLAQTQNRDGSGMEMRQGDWVWQMAGK